MTFDIWCFLRVWSVLMLASSCFTVGWCVREHWEELKAEVKDSVGRR